MEVECPDCYGEGRLYIDQFNESWGHWQSVEVCELCDGTGVVEVDDEPPCIDDETGFDPYLGQYTDDC